MQLGAWHTWFAHTKLVQSAAAPQPLPSPHAVHLPPQSTSLSAPLWIMSSQAGAMQVLVRHAPFAQAPQPPPQSASVSPPFLTPSSQAGTWQTLLAHTPLRQSPPAAHAVPSAHGEHWLPPQSTSVSLPLRSPSLHDAGAQTPLRH